MIALALGLLAGWCVLRLVGADRRWPWRITELRSAASPAARTQRSRHEQAERSTATVASLSGRTSVSPMGRTAVSPVGRTAASPVGRTDGRRRRDGELHRNLCDVIDLLLLAATAGHTLHGGVAAVGDVAEGPVGVALGDVAGATRRGASLTDELEAMEDRLGPAVRPLVSTLVLAATSGAPLAPALARLGDHERRGLRRRAEARVRRLPVLLLAPLVGLVLPAFVVLTIVPVAVNTAGTAADLALPPSNPSATVATTARSTP